MSFFKLFPALAFVVAGCSLKLDAGKLRLDPMGGVGASGTAATAGAGDAESGTGGNQLATPAWSATELARLGFELLGTAELQQGGVMLTHDVAASEAGGLVYSQPLGLAGAPLHIALGFRIQASAQPGDGMALALHASPEGYRALGRGGGGMGYSGLTPCLSVEIDLEQQTPIDKPVPHIGFMPGCDNDVHGAFEPVRGNPSDGADWLLTIDWDPKTTLLTASLNERDTPSNATTLSRPTDLAALLGPTAFVAITAGTGELRAAQSVRSLQLSGAGVATLSLP